MNLESDGKKDIENSMKLLVVGIETNGFVLLKITSRECSPKLILWLVGIDTSAGSLH
jgi:hypothetical protein